jgi:23S rRNA pseudouridine955/2504/2580 synthase
MKPEATERRRLSQQRRGRADPLTPTLSPGSGGEGGARIEPDDDGARLDRWFKRHYPALAHGQLEKLLRTGQVRLDGKRAKAGDRISTGQLIRLPPQLQTLHNAVERSSTDSQPRGPQPSEQTRIKVEALVLHKDSSILVLNKPSGLATQGGSGITEHVDGLLDLLKFEKKQRPRLVHRLDRDTSGVLLIARTAPAAVALSESLRQRDASKIYWALTKGVPHPVRGTIRSALAKETSGREEKMAMVEQDVEGARSAITEYAVMGTAGPEFAWVAVRPVTGRMHQIRVHLASLGTPIVGDFKYGGTEVRGRGEIENRLHLHARSIDIAHPDGGRLPVTAPLPPHMLRTWKLLGFDPDAQSPFEAGRRRR